MHSCTSVCVGLVLTIIVVQVANCKSHTDETTHAELSVAQLPSLPHVKQLLQQQQQLVNNYSIPAIVFHNQQQQQQQAPYATTDATTTASNQQQQKQQQQQQQPGYLARYAASSARGLIDEQLVKTIGKFMGINGAPDKSEGSSSSNHIDLSAPLVGLAKGAEAAANIGKLMGQFNEAKEALLGHAPVASSHSGTSGASASASTSDTVNHSGSAYKDQSNNKATAHGDDASMMFKEKEKEKDKDDDRDGISVHTFGKLVAELIEAYKSPAAFKHFIERQLQHANAAVQHHFHGLIRALLTPIHLWVQLLEKLAPPDACKLRNVCKLGQHLQQCRSSLTLVPAHMFDDSRYFRALSDGILGDACTDADKYGKCGASQHTELELPFVHFFKTLLAPLGAFIENNPVLHALRTFFDSITALFGLPPLQHHDAHLDSFGHTMGEAHEFPSSSTTATTTTTASTPIAYTSASAGANKSSANSNSNANANANSNAYPDNSNDYEAYSDGANYDNASNRNRRATKQRARRDTEAVASNNNNKQRKSNNDYNQRSQTNNNDEQDNARLDEQREHLLEVWLKQQPELYEQVKQWRQHEPLKSVHHFSNQLYSKLRPWERKACKFADADKWNPMCNRRFVEHVPKLPPLPKLDTIFAPFHKLGIGLFETTAAPHQQPQQQQPPQQYQQQQQQQPYHRPEKHQSKEYK